MLPTTIEAWFFANNISVVRQAPMADGSGIALSTTDGIYCYQNGRYELFKRIGKEKWESVLKDGDSEQMDLFGG